MLFCYNFPFLQYYKTVPPRRQISYRSPVPGRLLPGYADASSHDTGLDRLGIENTVSKIETAAANKALTLAGFGTGSTSRAYNDDTMLVKSPSEPFSIKELERFTTTTHNIQESAEAVECSDTPTISEHTVQEDNVQEQPETGLKQQREMTAQVLEIKLENKHSPTMADDDDELYDDITAVKQQLQDIKPSPSPVPGDPCTIPTQEEHQVVTDHQAPDDLMQMPTAGVEAEDTQSTVGDVVARSSPVPSKRNPPTKSPVPKPRAKKRSLSSPAPPKQDLASHITTNIDPCNTKPAEKHPVTQSGTKKDRPSIPPKPSLRKQPSSPTPTDKKETEAPSPRVAQKTALPTIPPRPMYASQKNKNVRPESASSADNSPNVSTLRKQFEPS